MLALVRFRLPDETLVDLTPGDFIGRHSAAALLLDDARVSEAHAMVSLRGDELKLLGLRGRFRVDGQLTTEATLRRGVEIELARELVLRVDAVETPEFVLALKGDGLPVQPLGSVTSLMLEPEPTLRHRYIGDAAAHLWMVGDSWRLRIGDEVRPLDAGMRFEVGGRRFETVLTTLRPAGATALNSTFDAPLRIVASYDTVHVHRGAMCVLTLNGLHARLISELVAVGTPLGWEALAAELWGEDGDRLNLRRRLDTALARLRRKLRSSHVRSDLVRADGCGHLELLLLSGDTVEDQT